jgi:CDP-2,3-bis-(O-geranylgeranyl)-sn-glycerol synthase
MILKLILQTLWLFLPALLANLTPPLVRNYFKFMAKPIDMGLKFRGKRLLGNNKTIRGLVCGVIIGILVVGIQRLLYTFEAFQWLSLIDYSQTCVLLLGFLLGFGALFGDVVESFFKRQFNVKPGKPFIPFDQIDFLVGAWLFLLFVYVPSWQVIVTLLVMGILLHLLSNILGYLIGVNKEMF